MGRERVDFEDDGSEPDYEHRPKPSAKKPREGQARVLAPEEGNGVVVEIFPNQASVRLDGETTSKLCAYRMATLAFRGATRERSPVCVGERVRVEAGVIIGRCERRNSLVRSAPNARNPMLHVILANIDLLVVVAAARDPEFTPGIVDRFLSAATAQKIPGLLCVNKTDLVPSGSPRPWTTYSHAPVLECSAGEGSGLAELRAAVTGKTVGFCGHSGVGKTSLLRRLLGDDAYGRVGQVNAALGKGRHTTTGAILLQGPGDSSWIDTPGIMNFSLPGEL